MNDWSREIEGWQVAGLCLLSGAMWRSQNPQQIAIKLGQPARPSQRPFSGIWLGIGLLVIGHWELPPPAVRIDLCSSSSIRDDLC
jgi:hypothetical protein